MKSVDNPSSVDAYVYDVLLKCWCDIEEADSCGNTLRGKSRKKKKFKTD